MVFTNILRGPPSATSKKPLRCHFFGGQMMAPGERVIFQGGGGSPDYLPHPPLDLRLTFLIGCGDIHPNLGPSIRPVFSEIISKQWF